MLAFSHIAAAAFKALFGLIGFLTFAEFTQKEISNSLPNQAFKVKSNSLSEGKIVFFVDHKIPHYMPILILIPPVLIAPI